MLKYSKKLVQEDFRIFNDATHQVFTSKLCLKRYNQPNNQVRFIDFVEYVYRSKLNFALKTPQDPKPLVIL
jgi:predicted ATPase